MNGWNGKMNVELNIQKSTSGWNISPVPISVHKWCEVHTDYKVMFPLKWFVFDLSCLISETGLISSFYFWLLIVWRQPTIWYGWSQNAALLFCCVSFKVLLDVLNWSPLWLPWEPSITACFQHLSLWELCQVLVNQQEVFQNREARHEPMLLSPPEAFIK